MLVILCMFSLLSALLALLYMVKFQRLKELFFGSTYPFMNCSLGPQVPSVAFLSFELSAVTIKVFKTLSIIRYFCLNVNFSIRYFAVFVHMLNEWGRVMDNHWNGRMSKRSFPLFWFFFLIRASPSKYRV